VRLVADTSALVDCPNHIVYAAQLGVRNRVHVLPVVLRQLDDLGRGHRSPDVREAAKLVNRRLEGSR
jgi:hypothetical protein